MFKDEDNYYLITEYCSGGNILTRLENGNNFSEETASNILHQILSGISYCHEKGIMHRNINPENILYQSEDEDSLIKLIGFGLSIDTKAILLKNKVRGLNV